MKYLYAALGLLAITGAPAKGQVGFGPEVGLNISNYMVKANDIHVDSKIKVGGLLGATFDIQLSNRLYLQPSVLYVNNGYKVDYLTGTRTYMLYTLESPVMVTYKFGEPGCNRFFVGLGPFVSYNWDAAMRTVVDDVHVNSRNDIPMGNGAADVIKRWDVGGRIVGGYQLAEGLYAKLHAQLSGLDLTPDHYWVPNSSLRNYNFGVSMGYLFGNINRKKTQKIKAVPGTPVVPEAAANGANATNPNGASNPAASPATPTPPTPPTPTQKKPEQVRQDR